VKIWSKGWEGSNRLWISIARDRYDVFFGTDVNSRRIGMDDGSDLQINTFIGVFLFPAHSLLLVKWGRLGPVADLVY
jgi:hypothetical protein